ncbi:unnamed protein product, partial [Anisakis simplex]|uniref:C3H1-type domain-containing protein n=1 Tax=Anisakis simplex TaxID=6269 RepID=A0A0M3KD80_ANISI
KHSSQFGNYREFATTTAVSVVPSIPPQYNPPNSSSSLFRPQYSGDSQRVIQSASDSLVDTSSSSSLRFSKPKSIYEVNEKKRLNTKPEKACFAFLKFGDCHYGDSCKFSHDPTLLNQSQKVIMDGTRDPVSQDANNMGHDVIYSSQVEGTGTTCRQLEKRLLQIQKELTMLEEESKKPKSSVVIPKRSQTLFASTIGSDVAIKKQRSSFNIGDDFVVLVGNSRNESTTPHQRLQHQYDDATHQKAAAVVSRHSSRGSGARPVSESPRELLRSSGTLPRETHYHAEDRLGSVSKRYSGGSTSPCRGDTQLRRSRGNRNGNLKQRISPEWKTDNCDRESSVRIGTEEPLHFDVISSSDDDDGDCELNLDGGHKEEGSVVEPLELSSVVNPNELIEISDEELPNEATGDTKRHYMERSSLRSECSSSNVLKNCEIIYDRLSNSVVEELSEKGYEGEQNLCS